MKKSQTHSAALLAAANKLHAAVDQAVAAFGAPEEFGAQCDAFTVAAKKFASVILAERIQRSFHGKVDPGSGFPTEGFAEKQTHTKEIREWLAPWNLAFECQTADGRHAPHQLYTMANGPQGSDYSAFVLSEFSDSSTPRNKLSGWKASVQPAMNNAALVDVTHLIRRQRTR